MRAVLILLPLLLSGCAACRSAPDRAVIHPDSAAAASAALRAGDRFPDFILPDARGGTVSSVDLRSRGPLVVTFYRGGWCPFCNRALHALQEVLPELANRGALLVAISPERPDRALTTAERSALTFPVCSDDGNALARTCGLVFRVPEDLIRDRGYDRRLREFNGDDSMTLPVPATYVIAQDGRIVWAFVESDYRQRADPADILAALDPPR